MARYLLLVALTLQGYCSAQDLWSRIYFENRPSMLFGSIIKADSGYLLTGVVSGTPLNKSRSAIFHIDSQGNMLKFNVIGDSINEFNGLFRNALIRNHQGRIVFTGYNYDSLPALMFGSAGFNLDSLEIEKYNSPTATGFQGFGIVEYDSLSYFVTGSRTDSTNANVALMKIDLNGNRLWEKVYDQQRIDYGESIVQLTNGNLLIGGMRCNGNLTIERASTWLLEVDTGGNVVRQWFDPSDSTYAARGLKQTVDGGFVYAADKKFKETINSVMTRATIVKMDSTFAKQWVYIGGAISPYTSIKDIEQLPNGDYIACGSKPYYHGDSTTLSGWIIRLNSSGVVQWENIFKAVDTSQSFNFLEDIDVLPSGDIIAVGRCEKDDYSPRQVGWFLKLDSNGCTIENCLVSIPSPETKSKKSSLSVSPNPASDRITVTGEFLQASNGVALIQIRSIDGRVVQEFSAHNGGAEEELNISNLSSGIYLVHVIMDGLVVAGAKFIKE